MNVLVGGSKKGSSIESGSEVLTESLVGDLGNTRAFSEHVDFDIHGLLGVRLVNPSPSDVSVVAKQLGLPRAPSLGRIRPRTGYFYQV